MIQVSMDGPNVNWKFYNDLRKKIKADYASNLINIGSCGLHIVNNSFKRGINATGWKVESFLSSLYYLFKDAPARREDYHTTTNATLMPLKFVMHRWLENVPVCQRALDIWNNIVKFVKAAEEGKIKRPTNKSYEVVKECVNDKCFVAKLHFFKCIASHLQPFLVKYQSEKPMVPFLNDDLCMLMKALMRRFIKHEELDKCSDEKLVKLDVTDKKLHITYKKIDIGYASEKLKMSKPSENQLMQFRMECKACLIDILTKLQEKCPASYSLVRHLSCLNPINMAKAKEACLLKFKKVITLLVNLERIAEKDVDNVLQEYTLFLHNIPVFGIQRFADFNATNDRIDTLFHEFMAGDRYKELFPVVKLILVLSHGQTAVEREFSVNKELEVENMKEHTLVARRIVCDRINSVNGLANVVMSKDLLISVKQSKKKYELFLENQRAQK